MTEVKNYYTTNRAMSCGVLLVPCDSPDKNGRVWDMRPDEWLYFTVGTDAFETMEEATAAALKMRDKKVASLEKQIAKLKAMTFTTFKDQTGRGQ